MNPEMIDKELDGTPIRMGLAQACGLRWSGRLQVLDGTDQVGTIVLRKGEIAWAVCKYQREDFGTFLKQMGFLTADQLQEVRHRYDELGGTKKIGALLLEMGLADRETLATYLALHIRLALAFLLREPPMTLRTMNGEPGPEAEGDQSFPLEVLLPKPEGIPPKSGDETSPLPEAGEIPPVSGKDVAPKAAEPEPKNEEPEPESKAQEGPNDNVLAALGSVPGYRASIIADTNGRLFAAHGFVASDKSRSSMMLVSRSWLLSSAQTAVAADLGEVSLALLECAGGILLVRWIHREASVFLAVFIEKTGKVGIALHRIDACSLDLSGFVTRYLAKLEGGPQ